MLHGVERQQLPRLRRRGRAGNESFARRVAVDLRRGRGRAEPLGHAGATGRRHRSGMRQAPGRAQRTGTVSVRDLERPRHARVGMAAVLCPRYTRRSSRRRLTNDHLLRLRLRHRPGDIGHAPGRDPGFRSPAGGRRSHLQPRHRNADLGRQVEGDGVRRRQRAEHRRGLVHRDLGVQRSRVRQQSEQPQLRYEPRSLQPQAGRRRSLSRKSPGLDRAPAGQPALLASPRRGIPEPR